MRGAVDLRRDQRRGREARGELAQILGDRARAERDQLHARRLLRQFCGAFAEAFRVEDQHVDPRVEHDVEVIRDARQRMHRHADRRQELDRVRDVQHLGPIAGERGDATAAPDAQALQRLHELTGGVAHLADREHRPAGELQQRAAPAFG